jgi:hypothetical protein
VEQLLYVCVASGERGGGSGETGERWCDLWGSTTVMSRPWITWWKNTPPLIALDAFPFSSAMRLSCASTVSRFRGQAEEKGWW